MAAPDTREKAFGSEDLRLHTQALMEPENRLQQLSDFMTSGRILKLEMIDRILELEMIDKILEI